MVEFLVTVISSAVVIAAIYGLVYWSHRAETDRSAIVGIYLLFGLPGGLLTVAGLALVTNSVDGGPLIMGLGLAFSLPLIRPFRRLLSRFTPFDPTSPIDLSGLAVILAVATFLVVNNLQFGPSDVSQQDTTLTGNAFWLVLNAAVMVGIAYVSVGFRIHRTGPVATERLGLNIPNLRTVGIAIGLVVPCFIVSMMGSLLTVVFQPDVLDGLEDTMQEMTTGLDNPVGAVMIGLSAGIGEEVLLRGAIQPRFGIVLTALLWTMLHAQYDISFVLLGLFGVGLVLGWERKRFGTTAAIITHALYNVIAVSIQIAVS